MKEPVDIQADLIYDGEVWFINDPAQIEVQVQDVEGNPLSGDVVVGLIDSSGSVARKRTATTNSDGQFSFSLQVSSTDVYRVDVLYEDNTHAGDYTAGYFKVEKESPLTFGPILSNAIASATGSDSLSSSVDTDTASGTLAVVVTTGAEPTGDQILAGENANGNPAAYSESIQVSTTGTKSISATGLASSTQYTAYWIQGNGAERSGIASATATTDQTTTVPTLSNASASGTGSNTGDGSVDTDTAAGTLYWIATTSGTTPTPTEIKNGNRADGTAADDSGSQSVTSTGTQSVSASGLSPSSVYTFYFVHENSVGDSSVAFASFSTSSSTLGASISLTDNDPSISVTGNASGGTSPYSYSWDFGDGTTATGENASHTYNADGTYTVELTVTDDVGTTATATKTVTVEGADVRPATSLSAQGGTLENDVTWTSSPDADIAEERLYRSQSTPVDPSAATLVTTVTAPNGSASQSVTDTGLTSGQTYHYAVVSEDNFGNTVESAEASATPSSQNTLASASFALDSSSDPQINVDGSNSSGDAPLSYAWDFGDGTTSTGEVTSHTYSTDDTYTVSLTVTDANGDTDTATQNVTIIGADVASATSLTASGTTTENVNVSWTTSPDTDLAVERLYRSTTTPVDPATAALVGSITDPSAGTTQGFTDTVPTGGQTYYYAVQTEDTSGNTNLSAEDSVVPGITPVASFTIDSTADPQITVDGSTSEGDAPVSYAWDFGDGSTATGATATHTYASDGTYTVTLTVTDADGETDTTTGSVTISSYAPSGSISLTNNDPAIDVSGSATGGTGPYSYTWDFGDGATTTGATASHTFTSDGTYTVSLTVTDADGDSSTTTQSVTISSYAPNASISLNNNYLTIDVTGSATVGTNPYSYSWDFGDGATATGESVSHTYNNNGTYTITLTVTDADGQTGTTTQSVTVDAEFQLNASTTQPASDVTLTIPHSELATGKTVSLLVNGADSGTDFTDDTTNNEYSLSYTPSSSIGSEEDLRAEVDGTGARSNVITITIEEAPDPVTDLTASNEDQQSTLSWTADDTVENDLQTYEVHRSQTSGFNPSAGDATKVADVTSFTEGSSVSYTDTGLTNGTTYYYEVIGIDSDGFTADSNEASATPSAPTTATINSVPTQVPARA